MSCDCARFCTVGYIDTSCESFLMQSSEMAVRFDLVMLLQTSNEWFDSGL
eukprot:m.69765 g.69765  ORF g.69765 m.69765 type:complete len:50 (+) comp16046_c0_seq2:202-351(+)